MENNFVSGSHFLKNISWKYASYEFDTFHSSKHDFFWDCWQDFDANTCPCQEQWVILTCYQTVKPCAVPSIQGPHLDKASRFFFQTKFCLAKKHCTILKLLTTFPISKRGMGVFFFNGISMHTTNKKRELATLENIINFVAETSVVAPWSAVKYQEKCQQLHSDSPNLEETRLNDLPLLQVTPRLPILRACGFIKTSLDVSDFLPFLVSLVF